MSSRAEQAVVLMGPGIGCNAAYEVGVLKTLIDGTSAHLDHQAVDPSIYTGSVFGAFNAAVMAAPREGGNRGTVDYLEGLWRDDIAHTAGRRGNGIFRLRADPTSFLDPRSLGEPQKPFIDLFDDALFLGKDFLDRSAGYLRSVSSDGAILRDLFNRFDVSSFVSTEPFRRLLKKSIDLGRLRRSEKKLRVVATNWRVGKPEVFGNSDMTDERGHDILRASAAFAMLFPQVWFDDLPMGAGGTLMATPLKPAILACEPETRRLTAHVVMPNSKVEDLELDRPLGTIDWFSRQVLQQAIYNFEKDMDYARRVNDNAHLVSAIEDLSEVAASPPESDSSRLAKAARRLRRCSENLPAGPRVTVHIYQARKSYGSFWELLNFDRKKIDELIADGGRDAAEHDCETAGCLLP